MARATRQSVNLRPDVDLAITELAKLNNISKTTVISAILNDMLPMLKKTVSAIKRAQEGKDQIAIELMQEVISENEQNFKQAQIELNGLGVKHDVT